MLRDEIDTGVESLFSLKELFAGLFLARMRTSYFAASGATF